MHKIGVIGAGMITEKHLQAIKNVGRMEVKWLASRTMGKLSKLQEAFDIPHITLNYNDMLSDDEISAVLICTPPNLHKKMFLECLRAGKHVFLEKPAAMNHLELDEMIEAQKNFPNSKVCDCSARHSRLQPKYVKVKEIIDSGSLGEIYYVHHNSVWRNGRPGIEYHPDAKWFLNKEVAGGGPLFDWGVYDLSFHLGVLGDKHEVDTISDVMLKSGLDDFDAGDMIYDVEEMFAVDMRLKGGIKYSWERGNHANMDVPNETRIYGTRGGIKFGFCSWDAPVVQQYDYDKDGKPQHTEIEINMEGHSDDDALIKHFADLLDGRAEPAMPLTLAQKHLDIIWKCYAKAEGR